jgi:hypothetical protein
MRLPAAAAQALRESEGSRHAAGRRTRLRRPSGCSRGCRRFHQLARADGAAGDLGRRHPGALRANLGSASRCYTRANCPGPGPGPAARCRGTATRIAQLEQPGRAGAAGYARRLSRLGVAHRAYRARGRFPARSRFAGLAESLRRSSTSGARPGLGSPRGRNAGRAARAGLVGPRGRARFTASSRPGSGLGGPGRAGSLRGTGSRLGSALGSRRSPGFDLGRTRRRDPGSSARHPSLGGTRRGDPGRARHPGLGGTRL